MSVISAAKPGGATKGPFPWLLGLGLLLLIGFWLRLSFFVGQIYHIDEYTSMLAATMVAKRGLPILPSGLFYDHGLLFSLLSGAFIALLGFSEGVARWPSLLVSVFTIAAYYVVAQRLFASRAAGLVAATLAAFDSLSIAWGSRARMYALAHLFVLLSTAWLLQSTLKRPSRLGRYLFLLFMAGALLSHTVSFLVLPTLGMLLVAFTLVYRRDWLRDSQIWREAVAALVVMVAVLGIVSMGQTGSTVSLQDPTAEAPPPLGLEFLRGFFLPGLEWSRFDDLVGFFLDPLYRWLLIAIALSLTATLIRVLRRPVAFADVVLLFLVLFVATIIFEVGGLLTHNWHKTRYLFILCLPAFFLLSAESVTRVIRGIIRLVGSLTGRAIEGRWTQSGVSMAGMLLVIGVLGSSALEMTRAQGTGDYNTVFAFVRENWQRGDKIMTVHPAAAYLYLGRNDYYANQVSAKVLSADEDEIGAIGDTLYDRYTGSPLIDSVEAFNAALAEDNRVWFVVDRSRLHRRYEPFFTQQIFAQMDYVYQGGTVYAFLSRTYPVPLPAEPSAALDDNFSNLVHLRGYNLDPAAIAPDGTVSLGLYWRPIGGPTRPLKVFVQLRDGRGETIAQADHFIYEGLLDSSEWHRLREKNEWLRDSADLRLPVSLSAHQGPYRIYVGLYDPNTLERVPLMNDSSGENAAVIVVNE